MSSRQLRRLRQQNELKQQEHSKDGDGEHVQSVDDNAIPVASIVTKSRASLFAALGDDNDDDTQSDGSDDTTNDQNSGGRKEGKSKPDVDTLGSVPVTQTALKKKKQKKRKKKTKTVEGAAISTAEKSSENEEDEIDKAIRELNIATIAEGPSSQTTTVITSTSSRANELLSIDPHHLKAINEMRNLFGREVIEHTSAEEDQEANLRLRRNARQQVDLETFLREPPGAKKLPEITLRRNIFIQGRDHWPRQSAGGLTMKEIEADSQGQWIEYAYCHNADYDSLQAVFFAYVQMGDPMRMVHLLKEIPYHVSTLLQVSSVAKQDQNMSLAAELLEKALFSFGRVATLAFRQNLERGKARISFHRPENRQLWLAGYHYIKSLIRKGTYRTALEWAKLLYSLDHKDPYGMVNFIHFLAIRAHQSEWLLGFLEELQLSVEATDIGYVRHTAALAALQVGNTDTAREFLEHGIRQAPWLYCALFQELGLDAPPSIWGISTDSNARSFWVKLYIYQTKDLWSSGQVTALLQTVASSLEKVDTSTLPSEDPVPGLNVVRLAYLEGQTSLLALAPPAMLESQPNYEFDPLPPPEEENIFSGEGSRMPWQDGRSDDQRGDRNLLQQIHRLMAQQQGAAMPRGGAIGMGDMAPEDDEVEENASDDEELRRDIEAAATRANEPGLIQALMGMLGMGGGESGDNRGQQENQDAREP